MQHPHTVRKAHCKLGQPYTSTNMQRSKINPHPSLPHARFHIPLGGFHGWDCS